MQAHFSPRFSKRTSRRRQRDKKKEGKGGKEVGRQMDLSLSLSLSHPSPTNYLPLPPKKVCLVWPSSGVPGCITGKTPYLWMNSAQGLQQREPLSSLPWALQSVSHTLPLAASISVVTSTRSWRLITSGTQWDLARSPVPSWLSFLKEIGL